MLKRIWIGCLLLFAAGTSALLHAQIAENVFSTDYHLAAEKKGELAVEVDNLTFFKNNEYEGDIMKGYTLPGFWLNGKVVYYPLEHIKLEVGIHTRYYYGTKRYPSYAYQDIANWNPDSYQSGVRVLPYFRGQVALSEQWNLVLGNIYGGSSHRLVEPLYNPELNLTADPEMGAQLLFDSRFLDVDIWVNWESFIFRKDTHQEAFTFGLSSRIKYNDPQATIHLYSPLQVLAQHRGGEIDTIQTNSVQTLMNGALGLGVDWNTSMPLLTKVSAQVNLLGYYQQAGQLWPKDNGKALHLSLAADVSAFRIKTGYWKGDDFISLFGIPYYGTVSMVEPNHVYQDPATIYFGCEYTRSFGKGYSLGVDLDIYRTKSAGVQSATSFSAGVYLRVNPAFLLKRYND